MNMSKNMEKIKATLLFVVKSVIFLLLARRFLIGFYIVPAFIILAMEDFLPEWYSYITFPFRLIPYCIYMFLMYFTTKKLDIIKVLDNLPLKYLVLVLFVFEIPLTISIPANLGHESPLIFIGHKYKLIIKNIFDASYLGFGFIYTYITYKIIKFLIRKYPKKFSWLDKLYPKKLEEIISFKNFKNIFRKIFNKDKCS